MVSLLSRARALVLLSLLLVASTPVPEVGAEQVSEEPVRWSIGFHELPDGIRPGDTWQGHPVLFVEPVLRFIVVGAGDIAPQHDDPDVRYVERDELVSVLFTPNDASWSHQYGPKRIRADAAWDYSLGETARVLCVIDSGVRSTHEDLTGSRWLGGYNVPAGSTNVGDTHGHGTHVTGIAAATIHNGKGIAGIGNVPFKHVKVMDSNGLIYSSYVSAAIRWCADNGGDVINLSLGSPGADSGQQSAVRYAQGKGLIIFAASGNDGCNGTSCVIYPAAFPEVIAVGCTTSSDARCYFSNAGPELELVAPGFDILSTCKGSDGQYCDMSGTSMSSPTAAGAAALIWSYYPHLTASDLRQLLRATAKDLGTAGKDNLYGYGLVDARATLDAVIPRFPLTPWLEEDFDTGTATGWQLSGEWRVASVCGDPVSPPNYLGYHVSGACHYDTVVASSGHASVEVDLTEALQGQLELKHRWETESSSDGVDRMTLAISTDQGATWSTIRQWDSTSPNRYSWQDLNETLDPYLGNLVRIRLSFDTVNALFNSYRGWHIDDFRVLATDNYPPIAQAGADATASDIDGNGEEPVPLDGTQSSDDLDGGTLVAYDWFLGDTLLGSGPAPTLAVPVGTHTVTLRVTDDKGGTAEDDVLVTVVPNVGPSADAGPDLAVSDHDSDGNGTVTLTGGGSDPDGSIVSYVWSQDGNVIAEGQTTTASLPLGTHEIVLTVADEGGATAQDSLQVTVGPNQPPLADPGPDRYVTDQNGSGDAEVLLDASASHDPDGALVAWEWSRDGAPLASGETATVILPTGVHTITLTVTDESGATATADLVLNVTDNIPPTASFTVTCSALDCQFDASASVDTPDAPLTAYHWDYGDGSNETRSDATSSHQYATQGTYTVCLTVTDQGGATATTCIVQTVAHFAAVFDFRDGTATGMTLSGLWHVSGLCASAHSGSYYLGYHQTGVCNFDVGTTTGTASFTVDLGTTSKPWMRFMHRVGTEGGSSFDQKFVEVRLPGGSWSTLQQHTTGSITAWTEVLVDLEAYEGKTVDLRFRFRSGDSLYNKGFGWHLDTIQVGSSTTIGNPNAVPIAAAGDDLAVSDADDNGTETVALDGSASYDPDGDILSYEWSLGGAPLATGPTTSVTLPVGTHEIVLTVLDDLGTADTDTLLVQIDPNHPPVADAGPDLEVSDGDGSGNETVSLDGGASTDDGTVAGHEWSLNGTLLANGSALDVSLPLGTHELLLRVTDNAGRNDTDAVLVTVHPNAPPVAVAGPDVTVRDADGTGAETVMLDGSASVDDGSVVAYEWRLGGTIVATGATATLALPVGDHTIGLTVTDNGGATATDTLDATVLPNQPPVAAAIGDTVLIDTNGTQEAYGSLDGTGSHDPDGPLTSYHWYTADTTLATTATAYVPLPVGNNTVFLTVTDLGGATATTELQVTVHPNTAPVAVAPPDVSRNDDDRTEEEVIRFDGSASFDPDDQIVSFEWYEDGALLALGAIVDVSVPVGAHNVTLLVRDAANATATDTFQVVITDNRHPVASFSFTCADVRCTFDGTTSSDPDGDPLTHAWRFGDGKAGTGDTIVHHFPHAGDFQACLDVADDRGLSDGACWTVHLTDRQFDEDFEDGTASDWTLGGLWRIDSRCTPASSGRNYLGYHQALLCNYQTTSSTQGTAGFPLDLRDATEAELSFRTRWDVESYTGTARDVMTVQVWSQDTGSLQTLRARSSQNGDQPFWTTETFDLGRYAGQRIEVRFTFDSITALYNHEPGWFLDDVRVVSDGIRPNAPPTATLAVTCQEDTCGFDGSASTDDRYVVDWAWDFGDGATGDGATTTHTYATSGTYAVRLTVTDNRGDTDETWTSVTVEVPEPQAPTAAFTVACTGETCAFDATGSDDPDGTIVSWDWDLGDGTTTSGETTDHTYPGPGNYSVLLTVTDDDGLTATSDRIVTIGTPSPPTADFTVHCEGTDCTFDAAASSDPDGTIVAHQWEFGDGTNGTGLRVDHRYPSTGNYTVRLTVLDDDGKNDTRVKTIPVAEAPGVKDPPPYAPADAQVPDTSSDLVGDLVPVPWMDIQSAWFDDDADHLYVGMKLLDVPASDRITAFVAYRVYFTPTWTLTDPTLGGAIPPGETVRRFEVRTLLSPVGQPGAPTAEHSLWAETRHDTTYQNRWRPVAELEGSLSIDTDIIWWPIERSDLGAPAVATLTDPSAIASPSIRGVQSTYGITGDTTGEGRDHTF